VPADDELEAPVREDVVQDAARDRLGECETLEPARLRRQTRMATPPAFDELQRPGTHLISKGKRKDRAGTGDKERSG
jgi:hypothetical protein